jgi:hypothetical protein
VVWGGMRLRRSYLWGALVVGLVLGAGAIGRASVPHTFNAGDTLAAADLNANFTGLDQRITALEAKEPFAGTFPAVRGAGYEPVFCGTAPATINVSSAVPTTSYGQSNAFGDIVFTSGGAVSLIESWDESASACTGMTVCAAPLTYYLKSPVDQTITVHAYLDNTGAVYVNGTQQAMTTTGNITLSYNATANTAFSLSFMSCSNDGPSLAFTVNDAFITKYSLQVDYDTTFHRNGK